MTATLSRALVALALALALAPAASYTCDNSLISPDNVVKAAYTAHAGHGHGVSRIHGHDAAAQAYAARRLRERDSTLVPPTLAATLLPLSSVTLLEGGRGWAAQNSTLAWLHMFEADRLLFSFRATANLSTQGAVSYGSWEAPDSLLRGHITGGHFLSAAAQMVNATGDVALRATLSVLVGELSKCQAANAAAFGSGYLSAFPPTQFDCLENGVSASCKIWSPYYTIAKILRGLFDVYSLVGDARAADVARGMLAYFAGRARNFIAVHTIAAWQPLLNAEFGGLNDVAFLWHRAFSGAGGAGADDALFLAGAFNKACLLGPMALNEDYLAGIHANTHIPIVVGAATGYEVTGDATLKMATEGYYNAVRGGHTFASGGSSMGEWWGEPHRLGDGLDVNGVESCTTYNTLKVTRALFSWTLESEYMDFYERSKYSGMHGTMHPTAVGRIIYLLPERGPDGLAGGSKAHSYWGWSDPTESMWCCVGSGMESHSKHGELLFMEQRRDGAAPALLITLYDDASVTWPVPGGVATVTQRPVFSATSLVVTVSVAVAGGSAFSLALRIPGWAEGPTATLNGVPIDTTASWFNVSARVWASDVILATFPFSPRLEHLDDDRPQFASYQAVVAGPFALAAHTRVDNIIVSATGNATSTWLRPLSADERARSFSLAAPGFPAASAFVRHDNVTGVFAAVLSFSSSGNSGPVSFALQPPGFLADGDDVFVGNLTLAEAEALCRNESACVAFTFESSDPAPLAPIKMYLKSAAAFSPASGWTSYISSRVGNALGGDEDGPDSTWIRDAALSGGAEAVSLRSLNRPGEYLSCALASACVIAHGNSAAFNVSASFLWHSPGLSGDANSVSLEAVAAPGSFLSFYGSTVVDSSAVLRLEPNQAGSAPFAAASSFVGGAPLWQPPAVAFVASTSDATVQGSRYLLLTPVADMASEWYSSYLEVVE